jgi:hypothetical protein
MRVPLLHLVPILSWITATAACASPLGKQYEYAEQLYLAVDGSATVVIDASIPSLVALHGLPLDPSLRALVDRDQVQRLFASSGCADVRVGQPWIRQGRRFVQIRVAATHVSELASCGPLSWSSYEFGPDGESLHYRQTVGDVTAGNPGDVNWDGREVVAFKLHLPSRIIYHDVKRLEDGEPGAPERGNILTWEQRLSERRASTPVEMEVRMDSASILYRTLWLFGGALAGAVLVLASLIWLTVSRAKRRQGAAL